MRCRVRLGWDTAFHVFRHQFDRRDFHRDSVCAVLGVCISNIDEGYNYIQALVNSAGAGIGFLLAMVLFSGMRSKLEGNKSIPACFQGVPITLVTAAFLSLAFMGFSGLV